MDFMPYLLCDSPSGQFKPRLSPNTCKLLNVYNSVSNTDFT